MLENQCQYTANPEQSNAEIREIHDSMKEIVPRILRTSLKSGRFDGSSFQQDTIKSFNYCGHLEEVNESSGLRLSITKFTISYVFESSLKGILCVISSQSMMEYE
jgi:hypothetical protein